MMENKVNKKKRKNKGN